MAYKALFSSLKTHIKYAILRRKNQNYNLKEINNNNSSFFKPKAWYLNIKSYLFNNNKSNEPVFLKTNKFIDEDPNRLPLHEWINGDLRKEFLSVPEKSENKLKKHELKEAVDNMYIELDKSGEKTSPPY